MVMAVVAMATPVRAQEEVWTAGDVLAARATASYCTRSIIDGEVGGGITRGGVIYEPYDPYMPHAAGELGPGGLHPRGLLSDFYAHGGSDPHNPYEVVIYIDGAIARGLGGHWTTAPFVCR